MRDVSAPHYKVFGELNVGAGRSCAICSVMDMISNDGKEVILKMCVKHLSLFQYNVAAMSIESSAFGAAKKASVDSPFLLYDGSYVTTDARDVSKRQRAIFVCKFVFQLLILAFQNFFIQFLKATLESCIHLPTLIRVSKSVWYLSAASFFKF